MFLNIVVDAITNNLISCGYNESDEEAIVHAIHMYVALDTIELTIEDIFNAEIMAEEVCAKHGDVVAHVYLAIVLDLQAAASLA